MQWSIVEPLEEDLIIIIMMMMIIIIVIIVIVEIIIIIVIIIIIIVIIIIVIIIITTRSCINRLTRSDLAVCSLIVSKLTETAYTSYLYFGGGDLRV